MNRPYSTLWSKFSSPTSRQSVSHNSAGKTRWSTLLTIIPALLLLSGCSPTTVTPSKEEAPGKPQRIEVTPITQEPTDQYHHGRIVWHDLLTNDLETAKRFYGGLFGWTFEKRGRYTIISNQGVPIAGMAQVKFEPEHSPYWLPYVSVADVDQAVANAEKDGAALLKGPDEMINRGRFALLGDPQGAKFVALHSSSGDPAPASPVTNGWLWNELWTGDLDTAQAFYQRIAAYQPIAVDDVKENHYRVMTIEGKPAAGLTTLPFENMNSQWIPALRTADLGQLMAKVDELGGRTLIKPDHSLADGNIALIQDPSGAIFMAAPWSPDKADNASADNSEGNQQ